mmetsp:Transcript_3811/g.10263  ORF Transcript_3811/g.10263 Transcript_3811/m.10263 type:complete len:341 (+) Transcript_3811:940-1962(+)
MLIAAAAPISRRPLPVHQAAQQAGLLRRCGKVCAPAVPEDRRTKVIRHRGVHYGAVPVARQEGIEPVARRVERDAAVKRLTENHRGARARKVDDSVAEVRPGLEIDGHVEEVVRAGEATIVEHRLHRVPRAVLGQVAQRDGGATRLLRLAILLRRLGRAAGLRVASLRVACGFPRCALPAARCASARSALRLAPGLAVLALRARGAGRGAALRLRREETRDRLEWACLAGPAHQVIVHLLVGPAGAEGAGGAGQRTAQRQLREALALRRARRRRARGARRPRRALHRRTPRRSDREPPHHGVAGEGLAGALGLGSLKALIGEKVVELVEGVHPLEGVDQR